MTFFKDMKTGLTRNVTFLGVVSGLTDISSEMLYPIVPIFLTSVLGAPMSIVGFIEGAEFFAAHSRRRGELLLQELLDHRFLRIFVVAGLNTLFSYLLKQECLHDQHVKEFGRVFPDHAPGGFLDFLYFLGGGRLR